jgi:fatty-acyl-CoA synthase
MPVTNVGKIYKPELRTLATGAVVQALINQVCEALGLAPGRRPTVQAKGDGPVRVGMQAGRPDTSEVEVEARLLALLETLPVKVLVEKA